MSASPTCLDCRDPLTVHPASEVYRQIGADFSAIYLCPFCRQHRYKSEAHAMARIRASFERAQATTEAA